MQQRAHNRELMEKWVGDWARQANAHPEITVGEWLYAFSIQIALTLRMSGIEEKQLDDVMKKLENSIRLVYSKSEDAIEQSQIH